uniref:Uncharacterized protein n=1 Tax=Tanacetum cinerariifolium TaxID=118510 RepID=A0A6L2NFE7_TANCI|nr:hypothetical protein [Tanacetum cinerariifolium]
MKEKGDQCILVGYSTQLKGYHVYNKRTRMIVESIHIRFDEIKEVSKTSVANNTSGLVPQLQKASDYDNPDPVPQQQDVSSLADVHVLSQQKLDLLFGLLYDEFFNAGSNIQDKQPTMNIKTTSAPSTPTNVHAEENNDYQAEEGEQSQDDEFTNPLCAPAQEEVESSSHNNDPEMCMYALTVSTAKPKKIKETMADSAWIETMHEELHQFDRLQVGELVKKPFGKSIIKLKWLWKNKKDEDQTVIRNKARITPRVLGSLTSSINSQLLEKVGFVAYKLEHPQELSRVHNTCHVSNLKKCYADEPLAVLLDELHFDDKLHFVEEPVKIMDQEVKRLKRSRIPIVKVTLTKTSPRNPLCVLYFPRAILTSLQGCYKQALHPIIDQSASSPIKIEAPRELPKIMPNALTKGEWGFKHTKAVFPNEIIPFLKTLKDIFNVFYKDLLNEVTEVQTVFNQMEVAVQQYHIDKQCFEIQKKQFFLENDQLLDQIIYQDIVNIVVSSSVDVNTSVKVNSSVIMNDSVNYVEMCNKCLELKAELIKQHNMTNTSVNRTEPSFDQLFELNNLKGELQVKDITIKKLKTHIKRINETSTSESVKKDFDEIETINIELEHRVTSLIAKNEHLKQKYKQLYDLIKPSREKVLVITALKINLRKLKGKETVDNAAQMSNATTMAPRLYKLGPIILGPQVKNNRETHEYYLKHTTEQAVILKEVVKQAKSQNPLDNTSYSACVYVKLIQYLLSCVRDTCPSIHKPREKLVAVTPINKMKTLRVVDTVTSSGNIPKAALTFACVDLSHFFDNTLLYTWTTLSCLVAALPLDIDLLLFLVAPKHVVTRVYTRRPKVPKSVPNSKPKVEKSMTTNKMKPGTSRGSNSSAPSSSSLIDCSLEPALHEMTPATPSSGLIPNPSPSTPFRPPLRHEWDLVFQPVFDEFFFPSASVASLVSVEEAPAHVESTSSPSSTTVDQDAPLSSIKKSKRAIAWKMSYIKGINPSFYTHNILMVESFKPVIQAQRRLNLKVQDVVKNEIVRRMPSGLCNASATFQICMTTIFHDMVEGFIEVFMDYFLVFGNSFDQCPNNLDKMLENVMRRCIAGDEILEILAHCHSGPTWGHHSASVIWRKVTKDEGNDDVEEEEDPQEEEDDIEVDINEDKNEPELTYSYEEMNPFNPPPLASESEPKDAIKVENPIKHEDETIPASVYEVGESSTAPFLCEDSDGLLAGLMRRDISSLFGWMASLSRRLCGRETVHALVEKKGKAKHEFYGKLILEVCSSVEQGTAAMEKLVKKLSNAEGKENVDVAIAVERARHANVGNDARGSGPAKGQDVVPAARECIFAGFMKCNPTAFRGTEGAVELLRWFEKSKSVFGIILETVNQMPWTEMKQLMTVKFYPTEEVQRIEHELWNLKVKEYNIVSYTQRFNELALMCLRMVEPERVKVDAYIRGLSDNIKGEVTSSKPTNLSEAVCMAYK